MPLITLARWSAQVWIELILAEDQLLTKVIQVLILKELAFHKSVCIKRAWSFLIDPTFTNDELRLIYDGCWSVLLITICHYLTKGAPRKAARVDSSFFNLSLYNSPTGQGITWSSQRFWRLWWWQPSYVAMNSSVWIITICQLVANHLSPSDCIIVLKTLPLPLRPLTYNHPPNPSNTAEHLTLAPDK